MKEKVYLVLLIVSWIIILGGAIYFLTNIDHATASISGIGLILLFIVSSLYDKERKRRR